MNAQCLRCGATTQREVKFCPNCGTEFDLTTPMNIPSSAFQVSKPFSSRAKTFYTFLALGIIATLSVAFFHYLPGGVNPIIVNQPEVAMASPYLGQKLTPFVLSDNQVEIKNGIIRFDFNVLRDKKFIQFTYHNITNDEIVIAYISPAGKMVTAIGLCEPCGNSKFTTDETELVSICGTRWKMDNLEFSGGCGICQSHPPDPIPSSIDGSQVHIEESLVKNWKRRVS